MNDVTQFDSSPSLTSKFGRGFGSGAFNGLMMMGIYAGVMTAAGLVGIVAMPVLTTTLITSGLGIVATGLFGGVMAIKHALSGAPASLPASYTRSRAGDKEIAATLPLVVAQNLARPVAYDAAPEAAAPATNWVERTGNRADSQSRIQDIISRGDLSDQDRAAALLADRQANAGKSASVA